MGHDATMADHLSEETQRWTSAETCGIPQRV